MARYIQLHMYYTHLINKAKQLGTYIGNISE